MAGKIVKEVIEEEYEFELPVSFVDVVFLLLIFFMCAANFRTKEKKLDAHLPKDEGQNAVPVEKFEVPEEIRLKMYWANNNPTRQWPFGQCIHSPYTPFPDNWPHLIVPLSTAGAHIVIQVGRVQCVDLNDLFRKIRDVTERQPDTPVVIDARQAVPFKWVLGAVDACARAKVKSVKFQAAAVQEGGGDDWWHM